MRTLEEGFKKSSHLFVSSCYAVTIGLKNSDINNFLFIDIVDIFINFRQYFNQ